jgi:5-methylthioribose kinase
MAFQLDVDAPDALTRALHRLDVLPAAASVTRLASAGAGNMNLTLRAHTTSGSPLIVKQSRPWVVKYPSIPAPVSRGHVEACFYAAVRDAPRVAARMPQLLAFDDASQLLVLEDLGDAADMSDLYGTARLSEAELATLRAWLDALHATDVTVHRDVLRNPHMRQLNHEHMFVVPFTADNGLDLDAITPGLASAARVVQQDDLLLRQIRALGDRYLEDGPTLLHGDFYPGSWLRTARGVRIIDPEFGFLGHADVDLGILAAHLLLTDHPWRLVQSVLDTAPTPACGFAGVEVLRRLLGVAQLPLTVDLDTKRSWIAHATTWILESR